MSSTANLDVNKYESESDMLSWVYKGGCTSDIYTIAKPRGASEQRKD